MSAPTMTKYVRLIAMAMVGFAIAGGASPQGHSPLEGVEVTTREAVHVPMFSPGRLGTVVVFLSAKCPCSKGHEDRLKALAGAFPQFQFVGIHSNVDEPMELVSSHFKQARFPFPVIEDPKQILADRFGALKTPHVFILSPKGDIVFEGGIDNSKLSIHADKHYLQHALERLSVGQLPETKVVKALGCMIKRG